MITRIKNIPPVIISLITFNLVGELLTVPTSDVIDDIAISWQKRLVRTCLQQVMKNDVNGVKEACDFVVKKGDIEPRYTSLAQGVYVEG